MPAPLTDRALNRALLARQGLLERHALPLPATLEAIGAVQAQQWSAVPVALWTRVAGFEPAALWAALQAGELVSGIGIRTTQHLVSAREHPVYAVVAADAWTWARTTKAVPPAATGLKPAVVAAAGAGPTPPAASVEHAEAWVAKHPGALDPDELAWQREHKWRALLRTPDLIRVPESGSWSAKAPGAHAAAPSLGARPSADAALDAIVRAHLRAFGPAGVDDVVGWAGARVPSVRAALARLAGELVELEAHDGRALYDLSDAPRPGEDVDAPPRLLAAYDSILLAHANGRRGRIMPAALKDAVYGRGNLQIRPSFTVDGLVAGTWAVEVKRRVATMTLQPVKRLAATTRRALEGEGEALMRTLRLAADAHRVVVAA